MSRTIEAYRCDSCRTWHDDEDDARECCQPSITEGWFCATCKTPYTSESKAESCCIASYTCHCCQQVYEIDGTEPDACCGIQLNRATPRELELAGQKRLAL